MMTGRGHDEGPSFRPEHVLWLPVVAAAVAFVVYAANEMTALRLETGQYPSSYWMVVVAGIVLLCGGYWAYVLAQRQLGEYNGQLQAVRERRRLDPYSEQTEQFRRAETRLRRLVVQSKADLVYPGIAMAAGGGCWLYVLVVHFLSTAVPGQAAGSARSGVQ